MCVCVCLTVAVAEHVAVNMNEKRQVTTCVSYTAKFPGQLAKLNRKLETLEPHQQAVCDKSITVVLVTFTN